ncbi:MAG: hypothetical protein Q7J72_05135 [Candidatus Omnitrophota bacterium]|nr:hypothetical protein [Candidatus Omnitrophota bacterium]
MLLKLKKLISLFISFCLILEQTTFAQSINLSHYFANPGKPIIQSDKFRPLHLRYLGYDNLSQDFKLLLDRGDTKKKDLENKAYIEENTQTLLKYFFIGLALPNEKFWVNLRPDAPDNIIDDDLAQTDVGKILLEADLQLKKDTAGWTSPQTPEGKEYWDKLYQKAGELFGTENITIPTLTRPWIVPDEIIIREAPDNAYIYKATLKVMLEQDYLQGNPRLGSAQAVYNFSDPRLKELNEYSTQLIKEKIIPKLTCEVNTSKRYAPLRQVYYSLILAQNFKKKFSQSTGENPYVKLIDSRNLSNLTSKGPWDKRTYFREYQKSFQQGEYNLKATASTVYGQTIRSYMSGGVIVDITSSSVNITKVEANRELKLISSSALLGPIKVPAPPGFEHNEAGILVPVPKKNNNDNISNQEPKGHEPTEDKTKPEIILPNRVDIDAVSGKDPTQEQFHDKFLLESMSVKDIPLFFKDYLKSLRRYHLRQKDRDSAYSLELSGKGISLPVGYELLYKIFVSGQEEDIREEMKHLSLEERKQFDQAVKDLENLFILKGVFEKFNTNNKEKIQLQLLKMAYAFFKKLKQAGFNYSEEFAESILEGLEGNIKLWGAIYDELQIHLRVETEKAGLSHPEELSRYYYREKFKPYLDVSNQLLSLNVYWDASRKARLLDNLEELVVVEAIEEFSWVKDIFSQEQNPELKLRFKLIEPFFGKVSYEPLEHLGPQEAFGLELEKDVTDEVRSGKLFNTSKGWEALRKYLKEYQLDYNNTMHIHIDRGRGDINQRNQEVLYLVTSFLEGYLLSLSTSRAIDYLMLEADAQYALRYDYLSYLYQTMKHDRMIQFNNMGNTTIEFRFAMPPLRHLALSEKARIIYIKDLITLFAALKEIIMHPEDRLSLKYLGLPVQAAQYKQKINFNHLNRILEVVFRGHPQAKESFRRLMLFSQRKSICSYRNSSNKQIEENEAKASLRKEISNFYYLQGLGLLYVIHSESKEGISLNVDEDIKEKIGQAKTRKREYPLYHEVAMYLLRTVADDYENEETVRVILGEKMQADEYIVALDNASTFVVPALDKIGNKRDYFLTYGLPALVQRVHYNYEMFGLALKAATAFKDREERSYFLNYSILFLWRMSEGDVAKFKKLLELVQQGAVAFEPGVERNNFLEQGVNRLAYGINYNYEIFAERLLNIKNKESSSALTTELNRGGIDLTALPITTQPPLNQPLTANISIASLALNLNINLDNEFRQIQDMLKAGIMPSSERIREYALTSSSLQKEEGYAQEIGRILGCIAEILRLEEDRGVSTALALKEMLILFESDKPARDVQFALSKITVMPREPAKYSSQ